MSRPKPPTYRTTIWHDYNAALARRGSLSIWFDSGTQWLAALTGKRGRQPVFTDSAIQTGLTLKALFGLLLRQTEPHRVCRRPISVSYAAIASASAGGMFLIGSSRRRLLNQSTHSSVAYSTASKLRQGPRRWMTSALISPLIVSASALS